MKNKKIIKIILLIMVLATVTTVILWPRGVEKKEFEEKTDISYTTKKIEDELEKARAPITIDKPTEINWKITDLGVNKKVTVEQISLPRVDEDSLKKLVKRLGLDWTSAKETEDGLVIFADQEGKSEMWWDVGASKLNFYKTVEKSGEDKAGEEEIVNDFLELIGEVVDGGNVKIEGMDYKKLIYPRWVSCLENEAEAIEIRANYYINGLRVIGFEGEPIRVIYKTDGQVIKMEIQLPFGTIGEKVEAEIRSFEEVRSLPLEKFLVLSVVGGSSYELAADQEKIKRVDVSSADLVYIYKNEDQILVPYLLFTGKSVVNDKTVDVLLALKATR